MNSIKKNFLYNASYQLLSICFPLITTPYISRVLGVEGIGVYSYAHSIAYYFVIFIMLGLNNYGCREIAKNREDQNKLSKTFWSIYFMQITTGVLFSSVYLVYCFLFSDDIIISLALGLYVSSACFDINWFFFGLERFKLTTIKNLLVKIVTTVSIFLLVNDVKDIKTYCFIMGGSFFLSQVILWPSLRNTIFFVCPKVREIAVHIKPNLLLFTTTIAVSLFKIMDKIMLGLMSDMAQVGFYESAERIIHVPIALITTLGTVMLPRVTNMVASKHHENDKMLKNSILFAMFVSSSMCFGIMGVSKEFVPLFYGEGYDLCIYLYITLLPSCLFLAFANVIRTQYLLPHQMDKEYVISAFLGAGVNLIINTLLIPLMGAIGTAVGTLAAEIVVCVYQSAMVRKYIPIKRYIVETSPFVLSGLVMFLVLYFIDIEKIAMWSIIMIKVGLGIVVYFTTLTLLAFIFKINYMKWFNN